MYNIIGGFIPSRSMYNGGYNMYTNLAYLGKEHEDIVDKSNPIIVTDAGY